VKPTWNAVVCKGDVGRMTIDGGGGGFGGGRGAVPGGPAARSGGPGAAVGGAGGRGPVVVVGPRLGRLGGAPATPPVVLSRNGKDFPIRGETNVRAGSEFKVTTERPSVTIRLMELDENSWVIFELPGFATAGSGTPQDSPDALRKASATSYYKGKDSLWVKVVSTGEGARLAGPGAGGTSIQVSR